VASSDRGPDGLMLTFVNASDQGAALAAPSTLVRRGLCPCWRSSTPC